MLPGTYFYSFHFSSPNATAAAFHLSTHYFMLSVAHFQTAISQHTLMTDFCTSFSRSCTSLDCYMHVTIEEQYHLFTLPCMLSYNEFNYPTNLLFFNRKRSTDLAQKHMPRISHSHQYYGIHFEWVMSSSQ